MKIPMEDWLRGCVYHDGRHGEVTLPADKVIEVANYIQLTRTSLADGMIEMPPYDRETEPPIRCPKCGRTDYIKNLEKDFGVKDDIFKYKCINCNTYIKDEPTTENCSTVPTCSILEQVGKPQADCGDFADRLAYERGVKHAWEVAQKVFNSTVTFYEAEDVAKQIDKDINVRSKGEPQTDDDAYFLKLMGAVERGEISDAGANQAWYEYINRKTEPQTDCPWK